MNDIIIGVISDTHGLLRPEAKAALAGSDLIIHAGDIGDLEVLEALRQIAPLHAVRGNVDVSPWMSHLPQTEVVDVNGLHLYVLHNIGELDIDPSAAGFAAVIYGHSHQPDNQEKDGVLYFNPASAGPKRFSLPIALGRIRLNDGQLSGEHIMLDV